MFYTSIRWQSRPSNRPVAINVAFYVPCDGYGDDYRFVSVGVVDACTSEMRRPVLFLRPVVCRK